MRKLFILFLFISATSWAQNGEQVVQDYFKAIGGEKLQNVQAILQKGVMQSGGIDIPIESYQNKDGQMYSKLNMMGSDIIAVAFDGKKGFRFDNATWGYKDIPDSLANDFKDKAKNMFGYFYNYKEKGYKVKYLGKQNKNGLTYDKVELILVKPVDGGIKNIVAYFNTQTHLLDLVEIKNDGNLITTETKDFKDFDGIKFPTKIVTKVDGNVMMTLNLKEVKINPPKPEASVFTKPKQ